MMPNVTDDVTDLGLCEWFAYRTIERMVADRPGAVEAARLAGHFGRRVLRGAEYLAIGGNSSRPATDAPVTTCGHGPDWPQKSPRVWFVDIP